MKIEMGESLFYSWLRHVKSCQIVQTNWKVSTAWNLSDAENLQKMMKSIDSHFHEKYGYDVFKQNASLFQLLQQGECDVLGVAIKDGKTTFYAVDVAFHEAGLNYGSRDVTVMKVIEKCVRTAFCLHGFLSANEAEIVFASPKINPAVLADLEPCVEDMNTKFSEWGYNFKFSVLANKDYNELVLKPTLQFSSDVADTSELFLRSYQMYRMFADEKNVTRRPNRAKSTEPEVDIEIEDDYKHLKIGQIARLVLMKMLSEGCASDREVAAMQTEEYSKQYFDLQFPLLTMNMGQGRPDRYYATPININGNSYYMCSEWYENGANNDRPYLIKWIENHKK